MFADKFRPHAGSIAAKLKMPGGGMSPGKGDSEPDPADAGEGDEGEEASQPGDHGRALAKAIRSGDGEAIEECIRSIVG